MKTPLILLHGALGSKVQFNELQTICAKEYAVYSFDFSGHGNSKSMAHFSINLFVDDLFDFMQVNHIEKANIFGHSMGGYIALKAALQAPESFGKIITLGAKFNWNVENAFAEVSMLNPDTIESKVPAFTKALEQRQSGTNWRVNLWRTSLMMLQLGNQPALSFEDIAKIAQNTLICLGDSDKMVSRKESENAAAALPNGQFLLLENTDHPIEKVDFIKLAGVIQSFLNQ